MKTKVDFGKRGVLTWDEALLNPEVCLDSLLEFAETEDEMKICFECGLNGDDLPENEYKLYPYEYKLISRIREEVEPAEAVLECIDYLDTVPAKPVVNAGECRIDWLYNLFEEVNFLVKDNDHFECEMYGTVNYKYDEGTDSVYCTDCPLKCRAFIERHNNIEESE